MSWQRFAPDGSDVQVGISVYKQPLRWIQQCINSALRQRTPGSLRVTIRTDGPEACSSETLHWLRDHSKHDPRLQLIEGKKQLGSYGSYRAVFAESDSTFLCQLDADDWLEPNTLNKGIIMLQSSSDAPFLYTQYQEVSSDGRPIRIGSRSQQSFSQQRMLVQFITYHLRIIRRAAYNRCGGYDTELFYTGDYDLSLRLCELGDPIHLEQPLYNYRLHDDNTSNLKRRATIDEAFQVAQQALTRRHLSHLYKLTLHSSESRVTLEPQKGPILIAGMHRSGTSLLALMLQKLGLDLGANLISADPQNPDGYGEDLPVVTLQREALKRCYRRTRGWPDWGWAEDADQPPTQVSDSEWLTQAKQYLHRRRTSARPWGWKDPRTTLFLNQWLELEPGTKIIAVYRDPWEAVDALQRLKPPVFAKHPPWALKIWQHYNQALARFIQQHPERCILVHSSNLSQHPEELIEALEKRWGWALPTPRETLISDLKQLVRHDRLHDRSNQSPLAELHQTCSPAATALLYRLDALATLKRAKRLDTSSDRTTPQPRLMQQPPDPELSIVITSHNQGDFLLEAVASAEAACGNRKVELLIVDDGSTEARTVEVLSHLDGLGYRVLKQDNQGLPSARNTGTDNTSAPILLFLDDDNRLLPPYLEQGLDLMHRHQKIEVVYGNRQEFGTSSKLRHVGRVSPEALWQMNRIDNCSLIRRTLLKRTGGYDPSLPAFEDWDLWLTALGQPQGLALGYLDVSCFEYRVRPDSMLQRLFSSKPLQEKVMGILRNKHGSRLGHGGFGTSP